MTPSNQQRLRRPFNQNPNTGLVATWTPRKGWQASGYGLAIPAELGEVAQAEDTHK
jgi:hypothetical protein